MRLADPYGIGARLPSELKIGDPVWYYPVLGPHADDHGVPRVSSVVRSEPWQLGHGAWVVKIEGRAGGVLVEHLCPREAE